MKTKEFFLGIVMCVTLLPGCDKEDYSMVTDPTKAILGKWELVALEYSDDRKKEAYKPAGYIEYLPDSLMGWYDYATRKYEVLQGKYWLDSKINRFDTVWYLHYATFVSYPDRPPGYDYKINFITNSQMSLRSNILSYMPIPDYIYKRKK